MIFKLFNTLTTAQVLVFMSNLITKVQAEFDPTSNENVAIYWGQDSGGNQLNLGTYCQSNDVDIILLAFMSEFPGTDDLPVINFSNACYETFSDGLLQCTQIASDIQTCQSLGKKVLLSLGGSSGAYGFSNDSAGEAFATVLWDMFGGGTASERPFGDSVVDGFDFDFENNEQTGNVAFATKLRSLYSNDTSKTYYLSAAPQCPYPDASVGDVLAQVELDFAFVQFYNNYCSLTGSEFNYDTWSDFAKTAPNPDIKIFVGLPASSSAAGSGFVNSSVVQSAVTNIGSDSSFGGIMLWDASIAFSNTDSAGDSYAAQMKAIVESNGGSASSSSTKPITSSTKTSSTSSKATTLSTTTTAPIVKQVVTTTTSSSKASTTASSVPVVQEVTSSSSTLKTSATSSVKSSVSTSTYLPTTLSSSVTKTSITSTTSHSSTSASSIESSSTTSSTAISKSTISTSSSVILKTTSSSSSSSSTHPTSSSSAVATSIHSTSSSSSLKPTTAVSSTTSAKSSSSTVTHSSTSSTGSSNTSPVISTATRSVYTTLDSSSIHTTQTISLTIESSCASTNTETHSSTSSTQSVGVTGKSTVLSSTKPTGSITSSTQAEATSASLLATSINEKLLTDQSIAAAFTTVTLVYTSTITSAETTYTTAITHASLQPAINTISTLSTVYGSTTGSSSTATAATGLHTQTSSSSSSSASTATTSGPSTYTDCSELSGLEEAECMNTNFSNGLFLGSSQSCLTDGELACSASGQFAMCNYGEWVLFDCPSSTACYAYNDGDSVSVGCNYSSQENLFEN